MQSANDVESRFVRTYDGLRLHYRHYTGPQSGGLAIVCLPGFTRNARDFDSVAAVLAARYRVLCPDFRGRGRSDYASDPDSYLPRRYIDDLHLLLRAERCHRVVLVGTSLGGLVGTLFSAIWPRWVQGLVLNDVGPEIDPKGLARIAGYVGKMPPVASWNDAADTIKQVDAVTYPEYGTADWLRTAKRRYVERDDGEVRLDYDLSIAKMLSTPAARPDQWLFLRRLSAIPILVLRGSHSDILARETTLRMQEALPALEIVEVPNRGHAPTLEEPVASCALAGFLARIPARRSAMRTATLILSSWMFRRAARRAGVI